MTVAFVRGVQHHPESNKQLLTTAMLKDWVVYNLESSQPVGGGDWQYRDKYNAVVSDADLRQSFMPAFEAGAVEGGARSMMTSYHALNGVPYGHVGEVCACRGQSAGPDFLENRIL